MVNSEIITYQIFESTKTTVSKKEQNLVLTAKIDTLIVSVLDV